MKYFTTHMMRVDDYMNRNGKVFFATRPQGSTIFDKRDVGLNWGSMDDEEFYEYHGINRKESYKDTKDQKKEYHALVSLMGDWYELSRARTRRQSIDKAKANMEEIGFLHLFGEQELRIEPAEETTDFKSFYELQDLVERVEEDSEDYIPVSFLEDDEHFLYEPMWDDED